MKIALAHPDLSRHGGAERGLLWLAAGLCQRGHAVSLFTAGGARPPEEGWPPGLEVREIAGLTPLAGPRQWLAARAKLGREFREYDAVNVHNFPATVWAGPEGAPGPPRIWYCHEPPRHLHQGLMRPVWADRQSGWKPQIDAAKAAPGRLKQAWALGQLRFWGRTHCLSTRLEPCWQRAYEKACLALQRVAAAKMERILTNSAHTAALVKAAYDREAAVCWLGVPEPPRPQPAEHSEYDVLIISSDAPIKNLRGALEALARLRDRERGYLRKCVVVGAPRSTQGLASGLRVEKMILHVPRASERELSHLYRSSRIVLYVPFDEPFGLVPVEAAMHGRPSVASREGGCVESVKDGLTGLLANPSDPREIAEKLESLLQNEGWARAMGEAARAWARERFSLSAFVQRFETLALNGEARNAYSRDK